VLKHSVLQSVPWPCARAEGCAISSGFRGTPQSKVTHARLENETEYYRTQKGTGQKTSRATGIRGSERWAVINLF
jgi:hypothetical protein